MPKKPIVQILKDAVGLGNKTETAAPETAAPETAAPETAAPETAAPETAAPETAAPVQRDVVYALDVVYTLVPKHNRDEIVQMEHYINMLRAPYSVEALKLFHRIING